MITIFKYYMTIIDAEYDEVYDFDGIFPNHVEAKCFLTENKIVGNTIIIHYTEMIDMSLKDYTKLYK